jgi:hypothetical protein
MLGWVSGWLGLSSTGPGGLRMRTLRCFAASCALLGLATASRAAEPDIRAQYDERKAAAGRDVDGQCGLALWCERNGLEGEKFKHLALAIAADPSHPRARGLMGLMSLGDRWVAPAEAAEARARDEALAVALGEYNARREKVENTAAAHLGLAAWCEEHGLPDEARAHWSTVTRLDPARDAAWRKLGFRKQEGRWVLPAEVAARRAEAKALEEADRRWTPVLKKVRSGLLDDGGDAAGARAALDAVDDPRAARAIFMILCAGPAPLQRAAIGALDRLDGGLATQAIARLALHAEDAEVRRFAGETLRSRDPRETFPATIDAMRPTVRYEVVPVTAASDGSITIRGPKADTVRVYQAVRVQGQLARDLRQYAQLRNGFHQALEINKFFGMDPTVQMGMPGTPLGDLGRYSVMAANGTLPPPGGTSLADPVLQLAAMEERLAGQMPQVATSTATVQRQQQADAQALEAYNSAATEVNGRAGVILRDISGKSFEDEAEPWRGWYNQEQTGVPYQPPPEIEVPRRTYYQVVASAGVIGCECFAPETPIHTAEGLRPIGSIDIGDRVLAQDVATGKLGYRAVLAVHRTPDAATVTVETDRETITTTGPHRFWRPGRGWAMARDLKPGDEIRTLGGTATVRGVRADAAKQTVFNLDVDGDRSLFVGQSGWLAHDHSLPRAVNRPFDSE